MYRVIDTFRTSGLFAVLDPDQVRAPFPPITLVHIQKPDGESFTLTVERVEIGSGGVVALVFANDPTVQIPRGSVVRAERR